MLRRTARLARTPVSVFLHEPSQRKTFDETLAECNAKGIDMASSLSSDFALLQSKLLKYRVVRLRDELRYVRRHPMNSLPAFSSLMMHLVCMTALFFLFRIMGRLSLWPLVKPPGEPAIVSAAEVTEGDTPSSNGEETKE
ncbi:hypothetical protein DQ04_04151070 [Trypanosoma grayi]|uniref:hypothetical protein n=1 Tax=Trypanosoma grayi TaxID=71804 RepID=UPI0004F43C92|nr:hypothetical protein DQ04_04151070 [Trypanosoma grayi]KEG10116.1 hypothetical protein DQ04_04151070 [Trypanosoma grayi]